MYKFLMTAALMAGITVSGVAEELTSKKVSAEVNLMNSWLADEDVIGKYESDDAFDDESVGYDINIGYQPFEELRLSFGHNATEFDGESLSFSPFNIAMSDLELSATYVGAEYTFAKVERVSFFGQLQLGVSDIDSITGTSFGIDLAMYENSSDFYYGVGLGLKVDLSNDCYFKASYMFRDYGEVETTGTGSLVGYEDFDAQTSSINLGFGVAF